MVSGELTCTVCGVEFARPRKPGRPPTVCSEACRRERKRAEALRAYYANLEANREKSRQYQAANKEAAKARPSGQPAYRRAKYIEKKGGPTRMYKCVVCGQTFERERKPGRPPTVCSPGCRAVDNQRRAKGWDKNNPARARERRRRLNRAYYAANREKESQRAIAYARGAGREAKRKRDALYRALKRGSVVPGELFSLDDIFVRDGGVCHICGLPVERAAATMDHVIPITLGGPHTWANVKLAHRGCNARKGNRL